MAAHACNTHLQPRSGSPRHGESHAPAVDSGDDRAPARGSPRNRERFIARDPSTIDVLLYVVASETMDKNSAILSRAARIYRQPQTHGSATRVSAESILRVIGKIYGVRINETPGPRNLRSSVINFSATELDFVQLKIFRCRSCYLIPRAGIYVKGTRKMEIPGVPRFAF